MEPRNVLHLNNVGPTKENPIWGTDQKLAPNGSTKRMRLSDISNTVSSSRVRMTGSQFHENVRVGSCLSNKDYVQQVLEENTGLLKALAERNKIIELSNLELQKLRLQNRQLSQANTQMLAEINLSKDRLKTLEHELGCTVAVLRVKNSELNEKEKLNKELLEKNSELNGKEKLSKELREKIRAEISIKAGSSNDGEVERSKCIEVASDVTELLSVSNNEACRPNKSSQSDEKVGKELCEKTIAEEECVDNVEVVTVATQSDLVSNVIACIPNKKRTRRSQSLSSRTLTHQTEGKENDDRIRKSLRRRTSNFKEECFSNVQVVTDATQSDLVSNGTACNPSNKHPQKTQSLGSTTLTHQLEQKEIDSRTRKSPSRSFCNLQSTPCDSKDYLFEIMDAEIPACPHICETSNENNSIQPEASVPSRSNAIDDVKVEADEKPTASPQYLKQESQRSSVRPTRKAAEKVCSYKEPPLNVKMRRSN